MLSPCAVILGSHSVTIQGKGEGQMGLSHLDELIVTASDENVRQGRKGQGCTYSWD